MALSNACLFTPNVVHAEHPALYGAARPYKAVQCNASSVKEPMRWRPDGKESDVKLKLFLQMDHGERKQTMCACSHVPLTDCKREC